jgi:hypothetical protein
MATRGCDYCGRQYTRPPSLLRKYCSKACGDAAKRKSETTYRRVRRVDPSHPIAPPSGLLPEARAVLFEKIGPAPTVCHWCGRSIRWIVGIRGNHSDGITADHLDSDWRDDGPDNLVAACGPCNGSRARAISDDEPQVTRAGGTRSRVKRAPCAECGREFNATYGRVCSTCRKHR